MVLEPDAIAPSEEKDIGDVEVADPRIAQLEAAVGALAELLASERPEAAALAESIRGAVRC